MHKPFLPAAATFFAMISAPAWGQSLDQDQQTAVEAALDGLVAEGEPGYAVGIVRGGEVVFEHYEGLADLANGIPVGPESRFNIASNAKQYVALMALDLADRGMIDPEADFRTYLPDAMPEVDQTITVTQLVTHTSGIRDIYDLWALTGITWYERPLSNRNAIEILDRQTGLNFTPGSAHLYSNSNYVLLAELIAQVSGQPFHEYAGEFFARLGMEATNWRRRYAEIVPHHARAYGNWDGWLEDPAIANMLGDGFLFTTLRDQLAWEQQVQGAPSSLPQSLIAESQQRPDNSLPGQYGYGLEISTFRGRLEVSHIGSTGAYNAYVRRFPEEDLAIVVMGNSSQMGVVGLGYSLTEAVLGEDFGTPPVYAAGPETTLERPAEEAILGLYEGGGTLIRIVRRNGGLYREIEGRDPVRLDYERGNVWAYETLPDLKIVFEPAAGGGRQFRLFMTSQPTATYERLAPIPVEEAQLRALEGRYVNVETDTEIIVEYADGGFTMIKNGRRRELQMVQADELRWNAYHLRIQRDQTGAITGMLVDNNRVRNVDFPLVG